MYHDCVLLIHEREKMNGQATESSFNVGRYRPGITSGCKETKTKVVRYVFFF